MAGNHSRCRPAANCVWKAPVPSTRRCACMPAMAANASACPAATIHALKHVLQDLGVPPWQREHLPLLSDASGEVHAAGDRAVSATLDAWLSTHGAHLRWQP